MSHTLQTSFTLSCARLQDEDNDYAWIDGQYVALSAFWHKYEVNLVVPYKLRGHNVVTNLMLGSFEGVYYFDDFMVSNKNFASPPPSPPSPSRRPRQPFCCSSLLRIMSREASIRRLGPRAKWKWSCSHRTLLTAASMGCSSK